MEALHLNDAVKLLKAQTLHIGDVVECCSGKSKIIGIEPEYHIIYPSWLTQLLFSKHMPNKLSSSIDEKLMHLYQTMGWRKLVDIYFKTQNNSHTCSAIKCCKF